MHSPRQFFLESPPKERYGTGTSISYSVLNISYTQYKAIFQEGSVVAHNLACHPNVAWYLLVTLSK